MDVDISDHVWKVVEQPTDVARLGLRKRRASMINLAARHVAGIADDPLPEEVIIAVEVGPTAAVGVETAVLAPPLVLWLDGRPNELPPVRIDIRKYEDVE